MGHGDAGTRRRCSVRLGASPFFFPAASHDGSPVLLGVQVRKRPGRQAEELRSALGGARPDTGTAGRAERRRRRSRTKVRGWGAEVQHNAREGMHRHGATVGRARGREGGREVEEDDPMLRAPSQVDAS